MGVKSGADRATGAAYYLLTDPTTKQSFVGDIQGLTPLPDSDVTTSSAGKITAANGYDILNAREINGRRDLTTFAVPTQDGGGIKRVGLSEAFVGKPTLTYNPSSDTITDSANGKQYVARSANWVPAEGQGSSLALGWRENVGFANYTNALNDPTLRTGFFKILVWNLVFSIVTVLGTFLIGFLLALLFNDERVKLKGLWRSVLILPYALPIFVTAVVWKSMFNQDYRVINSFIPGHIDWLGDPNAAKAAIIIANLWLGFPYMFLVCTGASRPSPVTSRRRPRSTGRPGTARFGRSSCRSCSWRSARCCSHRSRSTSTTSPWCSS